MKITETKIYLRDDGDKKLKAYATITFDDSFVIRDLKVIDGSKGLFIAMPSRKMKDPCPKCRHRNAVGSRFCNQCGGNLPEKQSTTKEERMQDHRDIAHPVTANAREYIQAEILKAYEAERAKFGSDSRTKSESVAPAEEPKKDKGPIIAAPSDPLEARLQSTDL